MDIRFCKKLVYVIALVLLASKLGLAQQDTTSVKADTTQIGETQELILEEIFIEAVIEKPNVAILPIREKPDIEEVEFIDRSFEHELKEGPKKNFLSDSDLEAVKKIDKIKKILANEKK